MKKGEHNITETEGNKGSGNSNFELTLVSSLRNMTLKKWSIAFSPPGLLNETDSAYSFKNHK